MHIWHLTADAPRLPTRVIPGEEVTLVIGTWPTEPGQAVRVRFTVERCGAAPRAGTVEAAWSYNAGPNSYWRAGLGPFQRGDRVRYEVTGLAPEGPAAGPTGEFRVGPKLYLALLWHQHQPLYKDTARKDPRGSYLKPWVRLHALRDYYSMAALVAGHPRLHLTINLTPVLLWQLEDYLVRDATDRVLDLTLQSAERLTHAQRDEMLASFFDADWHNQIFPYPRYKELFNQRLAGQVFAAQDLRDLAMWFHLAWFGEEFRTGEVQLATGETASVQRFVAQGRGFSHADVEAMVEEQYKVMRAVVPIHRVLQERGQIEVSTTPFYHPILPLLVDTDRATIDRPGAGRPLRFAYPEDAEAQVRRAIACYERHFRRPPRGMWPGEGAVSASVIPLFARAGVRWIATDRGVLARSGRFGYDTDDPEVLCRPYRAEESGAALGVYFRDTALSDAIGFRYYGFSDYEEAAHAFLHELKARFAYRLAGAGDRVLTVILDGENAWGAYREDARPFLHALYGLLEADAEVETVTPGEYLEGNAARGLAPHPLEELTRVYELHTGSWIDEQGSAPGVDLGTWIGEPEENRAWALLGEARQALVQAGATPASHPAAFEALYTAEGSDWFWWYGSDQESGVDAEFDDLFRTHLRNVYRGIGAEPPAALSRHIVPRAIVWTFAMPVGRINASDRLVIQTNCPGEVDWRLDGGEIRTARLVPVGGVMAGVRRHQLTLGPFPADAHALRFRFRCLQRACERRDVCCDSEEQDVAIA